MGKFHWGEKIEGWKSWMFCFWGDPTSFWSTSIWDPVILCKWGRIITFPEADNKLAPWNQRLEDDSLPLWPMFVASSNQSSSRVQRPSNRLGRQKMNRPLSCLPTRSDQWSHPKALFWSGLRPLLYLKSTHVQPHFFIGFKTFFTSFLASSSDERLGSPSDILFSWEWSPPIEPRTYG